MLERIKQGIEAQMAAWLSHPAEYGEPPISVALKRSWSADIPARGVSDIHLVEYVMPGNIKGRGFVNEELTWSFMGPAVRDISDDDLYIAYCGWAWLFPALQSGRIQTEFLSSYAEAEFLEQKRSEGVSDIQVTGRYKIGTSELIEYVGILNGEPVRGAGDSNFDLVIPMSDPRSALQPIFYLLGEVITDSDETDPE